MSPRFDVVQADTGSSFRFAYLSGDRLSEQRSWHYHAQFELTWIIRGHGVRFVGDSMRRYGPGDLALIGPNLPHAWNDESEDGAVEAIVVQFAEDCFGEGFLSLDEALPIRQLLKRARLGLQFPPHAAVRAGELLRAMGAQPALERLVRLIELLDILAGSAAETIVTPESLHDDGATRVTRERLEKIYRYVRENLGAEISQARLATTLGLSSPAFSRFFKAATGKTFVHFVNMLRITEACRLLDSSTLSVTEVAMGCGYHNLSNFNRQFLTLKGMAPSAYRRSFRRQAELMRLASPVRRAAEPQFSVQSAATRT